MIKKILAGIFAISFVILSAFTSQAETKRYCKDIWLNNLDSDDIKIEVVDVELFNEPIHIDKSYEASAIVTMKVTNKGLNDLELSNIDIYPYQGSEDTKYFVKTSNDNVTGFIGNLKCKETKEVKVGIALYNTDEPIKVELSNIEDQKDEKIVESIRLK